jgi:hypothetical protein
LRVIPVSESFEPVIEEAGEGYNLLGHGRLLVGGSIDNLTLPRACTAYTR